MQKKIKLLKKLVRNRHQLQILMKSLKSGLRQQSKEELNCQLSGEEAASSAKKSNKSSTRLLRCTKNKKEFSQKSKKSCRNIIASTSPSLNLSPK